jgi:hypothetical protein
LKNVNNFLSCNTGYSKPNGIVFLLNMVLKQKLTIMADDQRNRGDQQGNQGQNQGGQQGGQNRGQQDQGNQGRNQSGNQGRSQTGGQNQGGQGSRSGDQDQQNRNR